MHDRTDDHTVELTTAGAHVAHLGFIPIGGRVSALPWDIDAATLIGGTYAKAFILDDEDKMRCVEWADLRPIAQLDPRVTACPDYRHADPIVLDLVEHSTEGAEDLLPALEWNQTDPAMRSAYEAMREQVTDRLLGVCAQHWPQVAAITGAPVPA